MVALAATPALAGAAPAWAGTYDVRSCSANSVVSPPRPLTGADDAWTFETNNATHLEQVHHCPPADDTNIDGIIAQTKLNSASAPLSSFAQWRFDAPAGTSLTRLRMWRYAGKRTNLWELYTRAADGAKLGGSDCSLGPTDLNCTLGGPGVVDDFSSLNTTSLQVGLACSFAMTSCSTGATLPDAWSAIYASLVTINDPLAPTAGGASGSLFGGGFVRGTVTAGVGSASDSTGIKALVVRVDGSVVARAPDRICDFTRRAPCPQLSAPESFAFPSTNIPDGTHSAEIGVVDTGENFTAAAAGQTITVDNTAPLAPAPSSPASITTAAAAATITWAEPGGQVAPITSAHVTVCGPTGCQTSTQAAGSGSGGATVSLPSFGAYNVSVALGDAAGNFAAGQATTWTITRPAPPVVAPMPPAPLPLPTPAPTKASPRLAAARPTVARDRRTIAVRGTVAPGVAGKVTVKATARIHGRARTVTRSATIRNRRYAVRLALPSAAWRTATVTASFAGDASHRSSRITRHVTQRRH